MFWQENNDEQDAFPEISVTDVLFNIECKLLPVDHAYELYQALSQLLPWLHDQDHAAIHAIHVAESGNGWMRPPEGEYLHLSRRTKLILRVPLERVQITSDTLTNSVIHIAANQMNIGKHKLRPIQASKTVFSRYVVCEEGQTEDQFLQWVLGELEKLAIRPKKMLCGRPHTLNKNEAPLFTRSLMLADLEKTESVRLQQQGLGSHRLMGCGIFLPHKGIDAIKEAVDHKLPTSFGL